MSDWCCLLTYETQVSIITFYNLDWTKMKGSIFFTLTKQKKEECTKRGPKFEGPKFKGLRYEILEGSSSPCS